VAKPPLGPFHRLPWSQQAAQHGAEPRVGYGHVQGVNHNVQIQVTEQQIGSLSNILNISSIKSVANMRRRVQAPSPWQHHPVSLPQAPDVAPSLLDQHHLRFETRLMNDRNLPIYG